MTLIKTCENCRYCVKCYCGFVCSNIRSKYEKIQLTDYCNKWEEDQCHTQDKD